MSATMRTGTCCRRFYVGCRKLINEQNVLKQTRSLSWWKRKDKKKSEPPSDDFVQKSMPVNNQLQTLKKRTSVQTVRGYQPPPDVEVRIQGIVEMMFSDEQNWRTVELKDRRSRFRFLTKLMKEFDHDIPSMELNYLHNVDDVVTYFQKEVKDTSVLEDMSKVDLPPNLHINLEPLRFNPNEKNNLTRGLSAFGKNTTSKVYSIKYRRKYKGSEDEDSLQ